MEYKLSEFCSYLRLALEVPRTSFLMLQMGMRSSIALASMSLSISKVSTLTCWKWHTCHKVISDLYIQYNFVESKGIGNSLSSRVGLGLRLHTSSLFQTPLVKIPLRYCYNFAAKDVQLITLELCGASLLFLQVANML